MFMLRVSTDFHVALAPKGMFAKFILYLDLYYFAHKEHLPQVITATRLD
jgi:hypothetical protein